MECVHPYCVCESAENWRVEKRNFYWTNFNFTCFTILIPCLTISGSFCVFMSVRVVGFYATFCGHFLFFSMYIGPCANKKRELHLIESFKNPFRPIVQTTPLNRMQKVQCKTTCFNKMYEICVCFSPSFWTTDNVLWHT